MSLIYLGCVFGFICSSEPYSLLMKSFVADSGNFEIRFQHALCRMSCSRDIRAKLASTS